MATMRITLEHTTRYRYSDQARYSVQVLKLTPPGFEGQTVVDWRIDVTPERALMRSRDGFGNVVHLLVIKDRHDSMEIKAAGTVVVEDRSGVVRGLAEVVPLRVYLRRTPLTSLGQARGDLVSEAGSEDRLAYLHALMERIHARVEYRRGVTDAATTAAEALAAGRGVCQDHAHIFIAAAREAGIPARYVTGYLLVDDGGQAEAHHAWAEAFVEGLGWIGFDVANCLCPTDRYVRMAAGLDAHDAAPVRGTRRGSGAEALEVEVKVAQAAMGQQ